MQSENLPIGVTLSDINGPQPDPPERDLDQDQDDDAAKRREDWPEDTKSADLEAIFCVALLKTLDARQTQAVVTRYIKMRDDADNVLKALERRGNNEDAQSLLRIKADIANFNSAVADFDALTNYRYDRLHPAHIELWLRKNWGELNTFYITFCALARRLGYELAV